MRGLAGRIREYITNKREFAFDEIHMALNVERDALRLALKAFVKRGELVKDNGIYRVEFINNKIEPDKVDKVWKAMRYLSTWTVREIALITGVEVRYVSDICKRFKKGGYIQKVGVNKERKYIYCVDKSMRERPTLKHWKKLEAK